VEQSTQTLPQATTCNAETQTHPWDEKEIIHKWKKEYAATQAKSLQEHNQIWINHTYSNWEDLEQTRQEARTLKKQNKELKANFSDI
jgi:hypothetical protein